jgi:hypothetical protein
VRGRVSTELCISYRVASHPPENSVGECHASGAQSGRIRAIFVAAGGLCPGIPVVIYCPANQRADTRAENHSPTVRREGYDWPFRDGSMHKELTLPRAMAPYA